EHRATVGHDDEPGHAAPVARRARPARLRRDRRANDDADGQGRSGVAPQLARGQGQPGRSGYLSAAALRASEPMQCMGSTKRAPPNKDTESRWTTTLPIFL